MNTRIWGYRCIRGGMPRHTPGSSWRRAGRFARLRMGRGTPGECANGRGAPRVGADRQLEPVCAGVACLARNTAAFFVRTFAGELDIEHAPGELLESPRATSSSSTGAAPGALRGDSSTPGRPRARAPGRSAGDESPGASCRRAPGDLELPGTSCRSSSTGATSSTQGSCQGL
jgi:hypothetical protein